MTSHRDSYTGAGRYRDAQRRSNWGDLGGDSTFRRKQKVRRRLSKDLYELNLLLSPRAYVKRQRVHEMYQVRKASQCVCLVSLDARFQVSLKLTLRLRQPSLECF